MLTYISERKEGYVDFVKTRDEGLSTGFPSLDEAMYGLGPGYHIIAARPSVGKTSLALNMALNISMNQHKVVFFSLEMPEISFFERIVCRLAGVSLKELRTNTIPEDCVEDVAKVDAMINRLPMYVDYKSHHTPSSILASLNDLKDNHSFVPEAVFIDYIQYMKTDSGGHATKPSNLAEISRGLYQINKDLAMPIVVLCQLSRSADEYMNKADQKSRIPKTPRLMELKGSGALEEDTDTVLLLHRSDYYKERESNDYNVAVAPANNASLIVAKNRQGPCTSFNLTWLPDIFKFVEPPKMFGE